MIMIDIFIITIRKIKVNAKAGSPPENARQLRRLIQTYPIDSLPHDLWKHLISPRRSG